MSNQNSDVSYDAAEAFSFSDVQQLKEILIKWDNEACPTISADDTVTIYTIPVSLRKQIPKGEVWCNKPTVAGITITFCDGDSVVTADGRSGIVLGSQWIDSLVINDELNQPRSGYFLVDVEIDGKVECHIRNHLSGERIRQIE